MLQEVNDFKNFSFVDEINLNIEFDVENSFPQPINVHSESNFLEFHNSRTKKNYVEFEKESQSCFGKIEFFSVFQHVQSRISELDKFVFGLQK